MTRPSHHRPDGRFRCPWPEAAGDDALRARFGRVVREWATTRLPPDPPPGALPLGRPDLALPRIRSDAREARITWVGHATFLVQLPGLNLLTDPIWSRRPSPVPPFGSARFVPAVPAFEELPPIDAVLLSHDHYDHLDRPTVRALHRRLGDELLWLAPLGYRSWFRRLGISSVVERDWWEDTALPGGRFRATATPARHWTRRTPWSTNRRLWCGWAITPLPRDADGGPRVLFVGDTAYASCFSEIGERLGPFDASLVPIGAYEPRWFMKASHADPDEAVRIYRDLGARGAFVGMHWGTFRLTFEDPLEPPERTRAAWTAAELPPGDLNVPRHGETVTLAGAPD